MSLGGKVRVLRFTNQAAIELEQVLDTPKRKLLAKMQIAALKAREIADGGNPGPEILEAFDVTTTELRALLWSGLRHQEPTLTLDEVSGYMDDVPAEGEFGEMYLLSAATEAFFARWLPGYRNDRNAREQMQEMRKLLINGSSKIGELSDKALSEQG